jgi:hypothetical protein
LTDTGPQPFRKWKRKVGQTQGLSADGRMLVRVDVRGQVRGYQWQGYKMKWLLKADQVRVSPDGRWSACAGGSRVTVVDTVTGKVQAPTRLAILSRSGAQCRLAISGRTAQTLPCPAQAELRFSPLGGLLTLSTPGAGSVYDVASGARAARHEQAGEWVRVAPISEVSYVVSGSSTDGSLSLFRLASPSPPPGTAAPRPVAWIRSSHR